MNIKHYIQGNEPALTDQYPAVKTGRFLAAWDLTRSTFFDLPMALIGWIWAELKGES